MHLLSLNNLQRLHEKMAQPAAAWSGAPQAPPPSAKRPGNSH